jgi:hypothetical protein
MQGPKYYLKTIETAKGHLNQTRKNIRSTKVKATPLEICDTSHLHNKKVRDVYIQTYMVRKTMFSNQTSQFSIRSHCGNKYIMVMVKINSNAILVKPMKNRMDTKMIWAYNTLLLQLKRASIVPKKNVLDKEVSENMKNHIRDTCKLDMELVPPGCHRHNAAEVAILCNFKAHFLSVLAGVANNFPPNLWDWLLPQTEITINLIQQSNAIPNILAYAHLSRPFNYNKMPLAPMGGEAQVHEKTDKRSTWAYHSVNGWYLFTSPEHNCTHNCHIKHTKSKQLSNTVQFQHKRITNCSITHTNKVMQALAECIKAIQQMTGKAKNSQAAQDLQCIVDVTQGCVQTNHPRFEETITPEYIYNMQQVPRVQAPASIPIPHTNNNRQITSSMQPQATISSVPTDIPTVKSISTLRVATITKSSSKPTLLVAELSKCNHQCKQQASRLHNSATATSPTTHIRTRAQVATAAAQVAFPSLNTRSSMQHLGMPPPTHQSGYAAAVMKQQQHQC